MPRKRTTQEAKYERDTEDFARLDTGLWSFDRAIGGGLPLRTITEISGWEWSGKTTLSLYLSALVNEKGLIGYVDAEPLQDLEYVKRVHRAVGFHGTMRWAKQIEKNKRLTDDKRLEEIAKMLYEPDIAAIVLDSVGAIYPMSEEQGDIGEGRVGERGRIMADFLRKVQWRLNNIKPAAICLLTNHVHQIIGGRGTITSGGKAVHYYSATRLRLTTDRSEEGMWIVEGKVAKRRHWGIESPPDSFQIVIVPGEGVHPGLTAVMDAINLGVAKRERTVSIGAKSFGYLKRIVEQRADDDLFKPFKQALAKGG